ncbi:hypothetical protein [Couchioplanes azureus]|uniref:hypothetical protein n=1 Tax=Couchioplanes caeruleus TaxID=56438 RepID=UPI001E312E6C|nr:hypothetical protein [Couchioplanes caeruleus]
MLRLQAAAGNAAVATLLQRRSTAQASVQRLAGSCPAPPVAPPGVTPAADPRFAAVKADLAATAKTARAHPPATAEVRKAQDAAVAPPDDKEAQAKAAQTDQMAAARPAGFDKAAFIAAVNAAVSKQAPKNLEEADGFATSGKADQVKSEVLGKVTQGKDQSGKDIAEKTRQAPDLGKAVDKPVTPLPPPPPAPRLAAPDPRKATPERAPAEQTDLRAEQCETHGAMAAAGVSDDQLAHSGEPQFTEALAAKKEGEQHTATAPAAVRDTEAKQLSATTASADAAGKAAVAGMLGAHKATGQKGNAAKAATKSKDEQDRTRITGEIKAIFDATKTDVETILNGIDTEVTKRFETGEAKAKAAFTADHKARMQRYKDQRYSGVTGALLWAKDLVADLPAEANNLFLESKKLYESQMQVVIADIADFVGGELNRATNRIAQGREQVKKKVADQPAALRKIAGEAAGEFEKQFDDLDTAVRDKQQAVVEDLAAKYVEARNAVDEEIKKLQEENKGLWSKAKDAVVGAIETIGKLKDMLLGVLARAAGAIELIVKDPIGFLGNLVNAVKTGVMNFGANILEHLKAGLKAWLLGSLASAGVEIPETFDLRGILGLVLSLLGLTWANVRSRILKVIPEPVLAALEKTVAVVGILVTEGLPGLWKWVLEKVGDIKEMVLGQIKQFVVEKIVKAGLTWIIGLLNPAAAFIKACKAIYDIVMFFVDKAAQIKEFVDTVLDSIESIARGGVGAVAGLIEKALAKAVPLVLGMLASLLGLGGISEKIKSILEKIAAPVNKVIDSVVGTVVKAGKRVLTKMKARLRGGDDSPEGKKQRLDKAMAAAKSVTERFGGRPVSERILRPVLSVIKMRYGLTRLDPVAKGQTWAAEGEINPKQTQPLTALVVNQVDIDEMVRSHDMALAGLKVARDLMKKNRVKQALTADPARKASAEEAMADFEAHFVAGKDPEREFRSLRKGKGGSRNPKDIQAVFDMLGPRIGAFLRGLDTAVQQDVKKHDIIQIKQEKGWNICEVTEVAGGKIRFIGHNSTSRISGMLDASGMGRTWQKFVPEANYKVGAAFDAIKDLPERGGSFPDVRQVLSYRAHGQFNVPPGMQWHHIHEHSAGGPNTVTNLVLSTAAQNQAFNVWFGERHGAADGCPWTEDKPLRAFLVGKDRALHEMWGQLCLTKHGVTAIRVDRGRGPFYMLV